MQILYAEAFQMWDVKSKQNQNHQLNFSSCFLIDFVCSGGKTDPHYSDDDEDYNNEYGSGDIQQVEVG